MVAINVVVENGVAHDELLPAANDNYCGVVVDMVRETMDPEVFGSKLRASMVLWKRQGKKGIWIKLPIKLANLVETAVKEGFWFHHAESSYLMLVNWIPEDPCTLPTNASHRVGVGAVVVSDKHEVLVVQENSGQFRGMGLWKIPTGIVDEGEDIHSAAVREVKEETGIDTEFLELLGFRQLHKAYFEKSDLFFVCMLRPLSFSVRKQELELEGAQWMPFEEYAAQPIVQQYELFSYITSVCEAKIHRNYSGFTPVPVTSTFNDRSSYFYMNRGDL